MKLRRHIVATVAVATVASLAGAVPVAFAGDPIAGGGATFMANMMDICGAQYNRNTTFNTNGDTISYAATGSGTGRTNFANGTYKFGGTESAYTSGAPSNFVYVPLIAGPIAIAYKLEGVSPANQPVRLSSATVARIFSGQIKNWNDPAIAADNKATIIAPVTRVSKSGATVTGALRAGRVTLKGSFTAAGRKRFANRFVTITSTTRTGSKKTVYRKRMAGNFSLTLRHTAGTEYAVKVHTTSLGSIFIDQRSTGVTLTFPNTPIKVAYRSGNSGTTNMFTRYLNNLNSSIWTKSANDSFTSAFPGTVPTDGTFQSASGNDGVANYVAQNNGAITYAELSFVEERESKGVRAAQVANNAGVFVAPSTAGTSEFYAEAAVADNGLVTPDYTVKSATAYLISAISYGLAGTSNNATNQSVKSFFSYFLNTCAPKSASGAGYAALTGPILAKALAQVGKIAGS